MVDRRRFMRLAGGAVLLSATGILESCSRAVERLVGPTSGDSLAVLKPCAQPAGVAWGNNVLSEAFYALSQSRSGRSSLMYNGYSMSDWRYPWEGDCCNALDRVTSLMYPNPADRGSLGKWLGTYQQGGQCKFFANLVLYRSSYGYPGGHLFLWSGYSYAPYSWQQAQTGWIIQAPVGRPHTAIVVMRYGDGLDVIDSNWVGGNGNYAIARHPMSAATLNSWSFKACNPWENPRLV